MLELTPDEARLLGVLIEKAMTTPDQYPLSLNAAVNGANQKNNREPLMEMDEDRAAVAFDGLLEKHLAIRVDQVGSRVHKFKHIAGETLNARAGELAVLAELLLRGAQTLGEIRGRASRMQPIDSLDRAKELLRALIERPEPLVRRFAAGRADRYAQLLSPTEPTADAVVSENSAPHSAPLTLADRVTALESEVSTLRTALTSLAQRLGENPFPQ